MKAIWRDLPYAVVDDDGEGVFLEPIAHDAATAKQYVHYADEALVIDPTDDEWVSAVALRDQRTLARYCVGSRLHVSVSAPASMYSLGFVANSKTR